MSCNVQSLISDAACVQCQIPDGMKLSVLISLFCNILSNDGIGNVEKFVSPEFPLTTNVFSVAHGLSATPDIVLAVFKCVANDPGSGFSVGDEIRSFSFARKGAIAAITVGANATTVFTAFVFTPVGDELQWSVVPKTGGGGVQVTSFNNFRLKIYAWK